MVVETVQIKIILKCYRISYVDRITFPLCFKGKSGTFRDDGRRVGGPVKCQMERVCEIPVRHTYTYKHANCTFRNIVF